MRIRQPTSRNWIALASRLQRGIRRVHAQRSGEGAAAVESAACPLWAVTIEMQFLAGQELLETALEACRGEMRDDNYWMHSVRVLSTPYAEVAMRGRYRS